MGGKSTHIRLDDATVDELYALKPRGSSYDDVVSALLALSDGEEVEAQLSDQQAREDAK